MSCGAWKHRRVCDEVLRAELGPAFVPRTPDWRRNGDGRSALAAASGFSDRPLLDEVAKTLDVEVRIALRLGIYQLWFWALLAGFEGGVPANAVGLLRARSQVRASWTAALSRHALQRERRSPDAARCGPQRPSLRHLVK